jgi:hypothetical protein
MVDVKTHAAAIRKILHRDWDPIGCGVPEDEYDSYLWPVLRLLQEGAARETLADYLRTMAADAMSCAVPEERVSLVVDKLMTLGVSD